MFLTQWPQKVTALVCLYRLAVALVLVALAAATALPLLWPQATTTALLNAFAFGVLAALPVLALGALARSWEAGPFSRLKAALTELRQAS